MLASTNTRTTGRKRKKEDKARAIARLRADAEFHTPRDSDSSSVVNAKQKEVDALIDYCSVHRTLKEAALWPHFHVLRDKLKHMKPRHAKEYKEKTLRSLAIANNMSTADCMLYFDKWRRRERMCAVL